MFFSKIIFGRLSQRVFFKTFYDVLGLFYGVFALFPLSVMLLAPVALTGESQDPSEIEVELPQEQLDVQTQAVGDDKSEVETVNGSGEYEKESGFDESEPPSQSQIQSQNMQGFELGEGTAEAPYIIRNEEEFALMGRLVLENKGNYPTAHYRLARDLTFKETYIHTPIGIAVYNEDDKEEPTVSGGTPFQGSFDGNRKTISGLRLKKISASAQSHIGFFGVVDGAKLFDLTLKDVEIIHETSNRYATTGGLVGYAIDSTISNIEIMGGSIHGTDNVGGVVGIHQSVRSEARIENSHAKIDISGRQRVGGLAGQNYGFTKTGFAHILKSSAEGTITGRSRVGGLIGVNNADKGRAEVLEVRTAVRVMAAKGCYATGRRVYFFKDRCNSIGGLIGSHYAIGDGSVLLSEGVSLATVFGEEDVGGLIGRVYASEGTARVSKSHARGRVTGENYVGGIIGVISAFLPYTSVSRAGLAQIPIAEAVVSAQQGVFIHTVSSSGTVVGENNIGGLLGRFLLLGNVTVEFAHAKTSSFVMTPEDSSARVAGGAFGSAQLDATSQLFVHHILVTGKLVVAPITGFFASIKNYFYEYWFKQAPHIAAIVGRVNLLDLAQARFEAIFWDVERLPILAFLGNGESTESRSGEAPLSSIESVDIMGYPTEDLINQERAKIIFASWDPAIWIFAQKDNYLDLVNKIPQAGNGGNLNE